MTRSRKKKRIKRERETKGVILISSGTLFLISLISFIYGAPENNYLGIIGYSIAWLATAIFGMGSYIIACYLVLAGWKMFSPDEIPNQKFRLTCFSIFLLSICMLLNIFAESFPEKLLFLKNRIFSETIYINEPYPHFHIRYNVGGIPFYYIYTDLPFVNLKTLLSSVGTSLIFSLSASASFFLMLGKDLIIKFKNRTKNLLKASYAKMKNLFKRERKTLPIKSFNIKPQQEIKEKIEKKISFIKKEKTVFLPKEKPALTNLKYYLPSSSLLSNPKKIDAPFLKKELQRQAKILEDTLKSFSINAKVGEINCGPTITSFEVHPPIGVKVQKIKAIENDIALNMQAKSIRIIAPIPGKAAVGVEVPSLHPQTVTLKEMLVYYQNVKKRHTIPLLLGKTVSGDHVITDLVKMPHLLIAGATGSGKSVCINTIVMSILMNIHPDEIKLLMIDPKKVELTGYSNLPHMIAPVITESHGAYAALQWLVREMQKRYEILKQLGLRNITSFNKRKRKKEFEESLSIDIPEKMPLIVTIIDEFADLMLVSSSDLETPIIRIAQMARAVGIHLIIATQRPSREVITGIIKANFPSIIAFKVPNRINSQIILDETGAETLLGNGDLLFLPPGTSHLVRAQGAFISDEDINSVIESICRKHRTNYLIDSFDSIKNQTHGGDPKDKMYRQALEIVLTSKNASTTFLQRKLKIGYARAASLIDELEENGVVQSQDGGKTRKVVVDISYLKNFNKV